VNNIQLNQKVFFIKNSLAKLFVTDRLTHRRKSQGKGTRGLKPLGFFQPPSEPPTSFNPSQLVFLFEKKRVSKKGQKVF